MSQQKPIQEGLFTWPSDNPQMLGSRCLKCGTTHFPSQGSCAKCSSKEVEIVELGNRGKLWTWTIQSFLPKEPYNSGETRETFKPYGVGYVELPGGVRVESRLKEATPEALKIGMEMELVIEPFREDEEGNQLVTFAFQKAADGAGE